MDRTKANLKAEALKAAQDAEVVILCMGLTPRMEGENGHPNQGFRGGDRTTLELLRLADLIRSIEKLGKPMVLILLNGSALAINWENENIPAILEAWSSGPIMPVLRSLIFYSGDYNPAGRLLSPFINQLMICATL